jgi:hypothetical protein
MEKKMREKNDAQPIWLNPEQLYHKFNIAMPTQARYRIEKKIPYHKIGSKIFYKLSEIDKWIDNAKVN